MFIDYDTKEALDFLEPRHEKRSAPKLGEKYISFRESFKIESEQLVFFRWTLGSVYCHSSVIAFCNTNVLNRSEL